MPVSTFDAWMAKQVRAENRGGASETISKSDETVVLPKDTFEIWIEKQKPRENVQQKSSSSVPDTFELWMSKQVAMKSSDEEKEKPPTETPVAEA